MRPTLQMRKPGEGRNCLGSVCLVHLHGCARFSSGPPPSEALSSSGVLPWGPAPSPSAGAQVLEAGGEGGELCRVCVPMNN